MIATKDFVTAPGVYDGFSARIALEVGFDCIYMTGAGTVASKLGSPDPGFASLNDMREHAEMIANLDCSVPLIADADTGYGGANMVARTVAQYHRSGVAGLHIEDQIQTKRCGHLGGKAVVDMGTFEQRILFLEGIGTAEEAREACRLLAPTPVLLNMVEHGATPSWTPAEAKDLGFRMMIFPFASIGPAYQAIKDVFIKIKEEGKTGLEKSFTPKKLFTIVGLEQATAFDAKVGGSLYNNV